MFSLLCSYLRRNGPMKKPLGNKYRRRHMRVRLSCGATLCQHLTLYLFWHHLQRPDVPCGEVIGQVLVNDIAGNLRTGPYLTDFLTNQAS